MMSVLLLMGQAAGGQMSGVPIPYSLRMDGWVTIVLLVCFCFSSWVLSHSRKFLLQQGRDFILHRERADLFAVSTGSDVRFLLLLVGQTCVLAGIYLFDCFSGVQPVLAGDITSWKPMGIYMLVCLGYVFIKWLLYSFIGWIFFDKDKVSLWIESYSTLLYYLGFALFPLVLFIVYFNVNLELVCITGLSLVVIFKILSLYKWLKLFCNNLYGCFLLILYFCALEIIPCLMLYRGLEQLNNYWIIKS